jgi:hypothetical protein
VWELDDAAVKQRMVYFASRAHLVTWSGTAERDIASTCRMSKAGVLEALLEHLACGYVVHADYMRNGDLAYIFICFVGSHRRYIKLKFWVLDDQERMHIFSAHPNM